MISCSNCYDQYVGSALDFKSRFRIHKSDIKTKKDRCGTARHFNTKCTDSSNPHKFLKVQIIESVQCDYNLEGKLWERERYWQCQLFTNTHDMDSVSDLYSTNRKVSRKKWLYTSFSIFKSLFMLLFIAIVSKFSFVFTFVNYLTIFVA